MAQPNCEYCQGLSSYAQMTPVCASCHADLEALAKLRKWREAQEGRSLDIHINSIGGTSRLVLYTHGRITIGGWRETLSAAVADALKAWEAA